MLPDLVLAILFVMAGYIYAVCRQGRYAEVKNGFTKSAEPFTYLQHYKRTFTPLEIIDVVPVSDAPLMERVGHHLLNAHRIDPRHELFDLSNDDGSFRLDVWRSVAASLRDLSERSGLALPEDPHVVAARTKQEEEARRAARAARPKATGDKYRARKLPPDPEERKELILTRRAKIEEERRARVAAAVERFINERCTLDAGQHVNAGAFRATVVQAIGENIQQTHLQEHLKQKGCAYRNIRIDGVPEKVYTGVACPCAS